MIIFKPHQAIEHIARYLPQKPLIIEAGAFTGTDTIRLAKKWTQGTVFAFEPVPKLYEVLVARTSIVPNIHCYQCALSDNNGVASLYLAEKPTNPGMPSQASSLLLPKERLHHSTVIFPSVIQVPTITLDTWAAQYNITHIDCAWLDIQGYELAVLQASPHIFATIHVLYLEVSFIESYANQPTYQTVKSWLQQYNFHEVGRDFESTKNWFFGNALFVRK